MRHLNTSGEGGKLFGKMNRKPVMKSEKIVPPQRECTGHALNLLLLVVAGVAACVTL
jgi:hypothetical protein